MQKTLVSIGMPTYEPEPGQLRSAIESVLAQTEARWTLFIHDDASQADVHAIVAPYLKDPRVTFARSDKRLGIGGNWNACLANLGAPFVQLMFQDDTWDKGYLKAASEPLERHPETGFVSVEHAYVFEAGIDPILQKGYEHLLDFKRKEISEGHHDGREMLRWWMSRGLHPNIIREPSFVMMRKSSCEAAGKFLEDMPQFLDVEYWTRLLQICDWHNVTQSHGSFRVHVSGASMRNQREGKGLFDRLRCMEGVMNAAEGSDRTAAKRAIAEQLAQMIQKFRNRKAAGGAVNPQGGGAVKSFAIKHPILLLRGLGMYLMRRS
jgi:glycosyltransferase involved in cell wall biosynthesis